MNRRPVFLLLICALAVGCGDRRVGLRIGVKDFAEQEILGEMLARLLRHQGRPNTSLVRCEDTYGCQRALQQREVDLMVEYSGTGLSFLGVTGVEAGQSMKQVRTRYAPLGLSWLEPLGFDNGYRLLVTPERASVQGLRSIADLERLQGGVRVACPPEYLRRPLDGLASLTKRYGLRLAGAPLVIGPPGQRFQAVLDGRADVAVGYATDGAIASLGLTELTDPLAFFPPYEAAVVVRSGLLRRDRQLRKDLGQLAGRIDTRTMRQLNFQVQVEGQAPATVARRFLQRRKLVPAAKDDKSRPRLVVTVHRQDHLASLVTHAIQAVRTVFPGRPVVTVSSAEPLRDMTRARAQLAVLGAERFFRRAGDGPPRREERVEALAVLATRMVHVIRNGTPTPDSDPLAGRVGVGPAGSGDAAVATGLLARSNRTPARHAGIDALLSQVSKGQLDAALVLAVPGEARLARDVARWKLTIHPLAHQASGGGWLRPEQAVQQPYLRPARIPAGTYAGQSTAVETLGVQVLLAGPSPRALRDRMAVGGGPAAALPSGGRPFTLEEAQKLSRAAKSREMPDPVLPSVWAVRAGAQVESSDQDDGALVDTLLNLFGIAFLVWAATLARRRREAGRAE